MKLEIKNANLGYGRKVVLSDVNFEFQTGEITCLLGPNGAGKSTLFKTLLGFLKPVSGTVLLNGKPINLFNTNEFARAVSYVPQSHTMPFAYTVLDVVLFGRAAHLGLFNSPGKEDKQIAEKWIEVLCIEHLKYKPFIELSGGERQLVVIARALAQEPSFLVMDEPTSNLDFGNQVRVLKKIKELRKESLGIFIATHIPDHAFLLNAKVIMVCNGRLFKYGEPAEIITEANMKEVYNIDVRVIGTSGDVSDNRKICMPLL
jgi:iron complex transport system ATP-binding protein